MITMFAFHMGETPAAGGLLRLTGPLVFLPLLFDAKLHMAQWSACRLHHGELSGKKIPKSNHHRVQQSQDAPSAVSLADFSLQSVLHASTYL